MQYLTNFYRNRCELLERRYQQLAHQYLILQEDVRITPPDLGIGGDSVYSGSGGEFWWENPLGTGEPPEFPYVPGSLSGERFMNPWWNQGFETTQTPGGDGPVLDVLYDDDAEENFAGFTEEELLAYFPGMSLRQIRNFFMQWAKRNRLNPSEIPSSWSPADKLRFLKEYWRSRNQMMRGFMERLKTNSLTREDMAIRKQLNIIYGNGRGNLASPNIRGANMWPRGRTANGSLMVINPDNGRVYIQLADGQWVDYTQWASPQHVRQFANDRWRIHPGQPNHPGGSNLIPWENTLPANYPYNLDHFKNWDTFQMYN